MSPEDRKKLDVWPGPIYLPYKPKYQAFFEVVMLLRRLILAISLSMIPSSSSFQTFVVWVVLASAIIHLILRPYDTSRRVGEADREHGWPKVKEIFTEEVFGPLVLVVLSLSFMVLQFSTLNGKNAVLFVWFVMVINTYVLIGLLVAIFYLLACKVNIRDDGNENSSAAHCGGEDRVEEANSFDEEGRYLPRGDASRRFLLVNNDA